MIDTKLITLLTLVEKGTYTKAANYLHLTQPSISHHINQLENEYHISIFFQNKRKLKLTEEGKILLKYARRALALDENLKQSLADASSSIKSITLAITPSAQTSIAPYLIAKYCKDNPHIRIKLITDNINNIYNKLKTFEVDLSIIEGKITGKNFTSILLDTDMLMVAVSSKHHLAKSTCITLNDLKKEDLILRPSGSGTRSLFESHLESHNEDIHNFHINMEIDDVAIIKELVSNNLGVTIISKSAVSSEISEGKIVCLPLMEFSMIREINLVYYREFSHSEIIKEIQTIYSNRNK